jgi:hypothetical protein
MADEHTVAPSLVFDWGDKRINMERGIQMVFR